MRIKPNWSVPDLKALQQYEYRTYELLTAYPRMVELWFYEEVL